MFLRRALARVAQIQVVRAADFLSGPPPASTCAAQKIQIVNHRDFLCGPPAKPAGSDPRTMAVHSDSLPASDKQVHNKNDHMMNDCLQYVPHDPAVHAITSCARPLTHAIQVGGIFDLPVGSTTPEQAATHAPVAQFYDLDLLDWHIGNLKASFGPTFHHRAAIKSASVAALVKHIYKKHGLGVEAASIGELLLARNKCGIGFRARRGTPKP